MKLIKYLKYTWYFFKNVRSKFIYYNILRLLNTVLSLILPFLYASLISLIANKSAQKAFIVLGVSVLIQFLLSLIGYILNWTEIKICRTVNCNVQRRIMHSLLSIPPYLLNSFNDGTLFGIVSRDSTCPASFIFVLLNGLYNIITLVAIGIIVFVLNWKLSLILILAYPLIYFINYYFGKLLSKHQKELLYHSDNYISFLKNIVPLFTFIKENCATKKVLTEFENNLGTNNNAILKMERLKLNNQICVQIIGILDYLIVNIFGIFFVLTDKIFFSSFIAFNNYSSRFTRALNGIVSLNATLKPSYVILDRLKKISEIYETYQKKSLYKNSHLSYIPNSLSVNNLSISFSSHKIFDNISFDLHTGEVLQLCGKNGCGKTTLLRALMYEYEIEKDVILINKLCITSLPYEELQTYICYLRQHAPLLPLSILDNLTIFSDNIKQTEVMTVCKRLDLWEDIQKLPLGLNTIIDNTISLSAGQIQKLQLARVLLKNPPIILMDEITANVDQKTRQIIMEICEQLKKSGTIIIYVSHESESLQFIDKKLNF